MDQLDLEVVRYDGPDRWYWRLSDSDGAPIADHAVELARSDPEWAAFTRLSRYLRLHVDPARPLSSEAEIVSRLGQWIADNALGPIGPALVRRSPATVALRLSPGGPADAEVLLFRPWELALIDGLPLARQDVSLVMIPPGTGRPGRKKPVGDRLRMLAVFSLPDAESALVLREQRYALVKLVRGISERRNKAIELTAVQYDVRRDRLAEVLEDGAGWDIVHFSGHGLSDGLILEGERGEPDTVPSERLIDLLRPGRERLKLLVLSSCGSGAAPPAEALLTRFGLPPANDGGDGEGGARRPLAALATDAVRRLDCGVLAMRYAVDDEFSIDLAAALYSSMLGSAQPLTRALQLALPKALGDRPRPGVPPLSAGIPALFGPGCLDLVLAPPTAAAATFDASRLQMAGFEPEPEHLIGRSGVLGRAARVLSDDGGPVGVMFTGAAGLGKTACALEISYRYENRFGALAWWRVPAGTGLDALRDSLPDFARAMERQLPQLRMADEVTTAARLAAFAPRLTALMALHAILVVLDGIDPLLTSDGHWRNPFWEQVVTALLAHQGYSRLVMSGRQPPRAIPASLAVEPLVPLTASESVLLARQLPVLSKLVRGSGELPLKEAKHLLAQALTSAAGNPAAIRALDRELDGFPPSHPVRGHAPAAEYCALIDRWTVELT